MQRKHQRILELQAPELPIRQKTGYEPQTQTARAWSQKVGTFVKKLGKSA